MSAPPATNPWSRGPPQQLKTPPEGQQQQDGFVPPPPPPPPANFRPQVRAGRVHHSLMLEDVQVHAYQLGIAQQFAYNALQAGVDVATYQAQYAMSCGVDPRLLNSVKEPGARLDGSEAPLGLTLIRDDQAYTHIELLTRYPHLSTINYTVIDMEPRKGAFFLATCPERHVHESIKYGYWSIPGEGAAALNRVFAELHGLGCVYILLASTDTVAFSGICQMIGPAQSADQFEGAAHLPPKTMVDQYRIPVRWIFCKNVPFSHMQHVALRPATKEAEEARKSFGGLQPMKLADGIRALSIMARYPIGVSVLMDFKYYDEAEARGVIAESGDASIRAAQKFQQKQQMGRPYQSHGGQQQSQRYVPNRNSQSNFPPIGAPLPPPPPPQLQPYPPSNRGDQQQQQQQQQYQPPQHTSHQNKHAPHRRLLSANDERVTLQTKFVFEPTQKNKQDKRKNRRRHKGEDEEEEGEEGETQNDEQQQEETPQDSQDGEEAENEQQEEN